MRRDFAIDAAADRFPQTFGLRAFPGRVFRINRTNSYLDDAGNVVLYLDVQALGAWAAFAKGSADELRREVR